MTESITIDGQTYKVGARGKVYALRHGDWVQSDNFTPDEIIKKIRAPKIVPNPRKRRDSRR